MNQNRYALRRRAGVVLAGLVGLVGIGGTIAAPIASAQADVTPQRVAGTNRFDTAAKLAGQAYPSGAANVILASGRGFPDALAGSALAGAKSAPLLLTEPGSTPAETTTALQALKPTTVFLLGGTAAISQAQQDELAKTYAVRRLAGADRYATAGAIGDEIGLTGVASLSAKRTAFIATGLNFADALAGGPLAAAGAGAIGVHPVLLVNSDVPAATDQALTRLAIQQVVVLGGTSAVSQAVADKLAARTNNPVVRYAGADRYDTASKVATAGLASYGLTAAEVLLANGADFADALAAGPFGFKRTSPLVLTQPTALPPVTAGFLEDNSAAITKVTAIGGTNAVSAAALTAAEKAAETPSNDRQNEGIQVSPQSAETVPNSGDRTFTASGFTTGSVDIVLVPCANVSNDNGSTKFVNTAGSTADKTHRAGTTADQTEDANVANVSISSVNGTPTAETVNHNDYANNVTPVNGQVTFDVSGPGALDSTTITCVVPVAFQDTDGNDALNVGAGNPASPSERFGTGGRTTFSASSAASGGFDVNVDAVDTGTNSFTGCDLTTPTATTPEVATNTCSNFVWDNDDAFLIGEGSSASNLTEFERLVSVGDDVVGTYTPGGQSTFRLVDEVPVAPTGVTASATASGPGRTASVMWTASASSTTTGYNVYRSNAALGSAGDPCPAFTTTPVTGAYSRVNSTPVGATATQYSAAGPLTAGGTYCYIVTALNSGNANAESGPSNAAKATLS